MTDDPTPESDLIPRLSTILEREIPQLTELKAQSVARVIVDGLELETIWLNGYEETLDNPHRYMSKWIGIGAGGKPKGCRCESCRSGAS